MLLHDIATRAATQQRLSEQTPQRQRGCALALFSRRHDGLVHQIVFLCAKRYLVRKTEVSHSFFPDQNLFFFFLNKKALTFTKRRDFRKKRRTHYQTTLLREEHAHKKLLLSSTTKEIVYIHARITTTQFSSRRLKERTKKELVPLNTLKQQ